MFVYGIPLDYSGMTEKQYMLEYIEKMIEESLDQLDSLEDVEDVTLISFSV